MARKPKVFILAATAKQTRGYLRAKKLSSAKHRHIFHADDLLGTRGAEIIRVGTWYARRDLTEIERAIQVAGANVWDDSF